MSARSKFPIVDVKKLKADLGKAPPREVKEISKREVVLLLAPEIFAMRTNGYPFEAIAERLTSGGIPIRATTLKGYLSEAKGSTGSKGKASRSAPRRTSGKRIGRPVVDDATDDARGVPVEMADGQGASALKPTRSSPDLTSADAGSTPPAARRSAFTPRKDSEEI